MQRDSAALLLYRCTFLGCLLGITATVYFIGGLGGQIKNDLLNLAVGSITAFVGLASIYIFLTSIPRKTPLEISLWSLILLVFLTELALGFLPPTARDELTHHLAIPKLYAQKGRIFEISFAPYSYYPMLLDMLYTPFLRWEWEAVPKLIHGLFGFLTGLLIYAYLARRLSGLYGLLGLLFFVSTPAVLRLAHWAYVDLGVTFYVTASLLCLLQSLESEGERRWLILAGLSAGFAMATKPNGLLAVMILVLLLSYSAGRSEKEKLAGFIYSLSLFLFWAVIPYVPWLFKNWLRTGNPFFPFFSGFFSGGGGSGVGAGGFGLGIFAKRELLYGESGWQILALPLRVFIFGQDDKPQYFDGVLNPMLILFLPWAFKGKWAQEKAYMFAFVLLYFAYAFFLVELVIRYILPIVPPLVILLVYGIHNIYLRIKRPPLLYAAVLILLALNGLYLWNYLRRTAPLPFLTGRESREAYLLRSLPDYPVLRYVNHNLPPGSKIYLLFMGGRTYYYDREYFHDGGDLPWYLLKVIRDAQRGEDIKVALRKKGITHLMVREDLLEHFLVTNLGSREREIWDAFARRGLQTLSRHQGYSLYAIDD